MPVQPSAGDMHRLSVTLDPQTFLPGSIVPESVVEGKYAEYDAMTLEELCKYTQLDAKLSKCLQPLSGRLGKAVELLGLLRGRVLHSPVMIACEENAQTQAPHTDVPDLPSFGEEAADWGYDDGPLSVLFALGPSTFIRVWRGSHRKVLDLHLHRAPPPEPIPYEDIFIPMGSMLVFSGALVHAGAAYDFDHCRVHFYLNSEKVVIGNATGTVKDNVKWVRFFQKPEGA